MVSAFSLCLLTIGLTAVSSQAAVSSDGDTQVSERRTFNKGKPVKFLPLIKKHKKFGGLLPQVFGKTSYSGVPTFHDAPARPLYKFHRYQGIEVKPVSDVPISAPESIIESHSSSHGDYEPSFASGHSFSGLPSVHDKPLFASDHSFSSLSSVNDKPIFSSDHSFSGLSSVHDKPVFASDHSFSSLSSVHDKPVFDSDHSFSSLSSIHDKPVFDSDHSFSSLSSIHDKPVFASHHSFSSLPPVHDKPVFSAPPTPSFAPLPPVTPIKAVFSFVPVASPQIAPIFAPIPFSIPSPAFSPVPLARPAPAPVLPPVPAPAPSPAPVFTPFPAPLPSIQTPQPALPFIPIKLHHAPALPPAPAPSPAPVFHSVSVAPPPAAPVLPHIPAPVPQISFSAIPAPSPAPIFHALPSPSPPPAFSAIPAPSPAPVLSHLPALPTPAPALSSISISSSPEPEFPYPPSGTPVPSYIKDVSLDDHDLTVTPPPTPEPLDAHHAVGDDATKNLDHIFSAIKADEGLFQKLKGWKADRASAALNHFAHFKKPTIQPISIPHNKLPLEVAAPQVPALATLQLPSPVRPLAPAPVFFPQTPQFFPGTKYESFPPNTIESPPLFNSYGVPIPHDSYASPHDRLAPAASEEEPAVLPPPSAEEKQEQNINKQPETQQQLSQVPQEIQLQNFQQSLVPQERPVYVPEENKTVKEEAKTNQEVLLERDNYQAEPEANADKVASNYSNHKE